MAHRHVRPRPGESAPFHFETVWRTAADRDRVWKVLSDIDAWPTWWPGMSAARILRDGERARLLVRSPLGRHLRILVDLDRAEAPEHAELSVSGDLRGGGTLENREQNGWTYTKITWCVVTRHRLPGALRPVAAWSHDAVMAAGQRGLRRVCGQPGRDRPGSRAVATGIGAASLLSLGALLGWRCWATRRSGRTGGPRERPAPDPAG
ncbi:SRPBCC family protein [Corynebacterium halotolerans]|uniref:SRPBCC family protein n=1 Tax=Corynebacterium halotolerans TaxID=225326 RepID=UPI003CF7CB61